VPRKKSGYKHDDDNIPYMTDPMKKALDEGKDLPIEQLVSGAGLDAIEASKARRAAPVRMDQMKPITKAEATRRRTQFGETLPNMPATKRVIPKPFERPRVVVSSFGGHRKTWQSVRVDEVQEGDIIPDLGRVVEITEQIRREDVGPAKDVATGVTIILVGMGGNVAAFRDPHERLQAFREDPDEHPDPVSGPSPAGTDRGEDPAD
jgi:hypothetical protein